MTNQKNVQNLDDLHAARQEFVSGPPSPPSLLLFSFVGGEGEGGLIAGYASREQAYGISDVQRHANDQESKLACLREWEDPLLYYKLQGEEVKDEYPLQKEDFILVMQTPLQRTQVKRLRNKTSDSS